MLRTLSVLWLFGSLGIVCQAADPAKEESKPYVCKDGAYKIQFPGVVKTRENKAGNLSIYTATVVAKPGEAYSAVYFDLPDVVPVDQASGMLKTLSSGIKGKLDSEKGVTLGKDKLPGRDAVYNLEKVWLRQYMIIDGKRVYQVFVSGNKEFVSSEAADRFIASFEVTK